MNRLIEIDLQVQPESEPEGYEFGYYTFDTLPALEVSNVETSQNTSLCHTCSLVLKARPFGLIKSLVLDSTILRGRHKISIRRLYWLCHLVIHSNCSTARLKTLIKTKQLDSNCSW